MPDSPGLVTPTRRAVLRGGAAAAALAVFGIAVAEEKPALAVATPNYQSNWAWCSLCSEAYYGGNPFQGRGDCPAQTGDGHARPGWNYSMAYNSNGDPGFQSGYRYCQYCAALFWPGLNPAGACVAGKTSNGSHSTSPSFNYAAPVGLAGSSYQHGWCVCSACGCYYHSNNGKGTDAGFCWVNTNTNGAPTGEHTPISSWDYELLH